MLRRLKEILREPNVTDLIPGIEKILREIIELYRPSEIILAGSLARGEFVRGLSDIDLLVIVEQDISDEKRFMLRSVNGVDVEITIVSRRELEQAISSGNSFYIDALKYGVKIYVVSSNNTERNIASHQQSSSLS